MIKTVVFASVFLVVFCHDVCANSVDCVKFLYAGNQKICMKTVKETSPVLAADIDSNTYYASAIPTFAPGGVAFEYDRNRYKLCNYDDMEYELIHWLSGTDELVNDVWRDRIAIDGALNFVNNKCVWNDEHTGYYSENGWVQYFVTSSVPTIDFGTDWYAEVLAQVGEPLGTTCTLIDFGSLTSPKQGEGLLISNKTVPGRVGTNTKPNGDVTGYSANTGDTVYNWNDKVMFVFGSNQYSATQSRSFVVFDDNRYYGNPYNTVQWNKWSARFYLFRGLATTWTDSTGFNNLYKCGPTTIYDIKIWRRKQNVSDAL